MRSTKRYTLGFINVRDFLKWSRFHQWKYVDAKKNMVTKIQEKKYTTGDVTDDRILLRKLHRHIQYFRTEMRRQDELQTQERIALFRAQHHPSQCSLETFFYDGLIPGKRVSDKD